MFSGVFCTYTCLQILTYKFISVEQAAEYLEFSQMKFSILWHSFTIYSSFILQPWITSLSFFRSCHSFKDLRMRYIVCNVKYIYIVAIVLNWAWFSIRFIAIILSLFHYVGGDFDGILALYEMKKWLTKF